MLQRYGLLCFLFQFVFFTNLSLAIDLDTQEKQGTVTADDLLHKIVNQLDDFKVETTRTSVLFYFENCNESLDLKLKEEADAQNWEAYMIRLSKKFELQFRVDGNELLIEKISGVQFYVKIPWWSDGISPVRITADASSQMAEISFDTLGGLLRLVNGVDGKAFDSKGIQIGKSIKENLWRFVSSFF